MKAPFVSFIICTYNNLAQVTKCLSSILSQEYPYNKIEIICLDGGSTDGTLEFLQGIQAKGAIKLLNNPNRLPEGEGNGKWLGYKNISSKSEYVAFIDQDNEIQGTTWIQDMLKPMINNPSIFGSHCRVMLNKEDPMINRYVALVGTDPFAAYRSVDGHRNLRELYDYEEGTMLITGGNCFMYHRSALDSIGGYTIDTDNAQAFAQQGGRTLAIPLKPRTWHHAADSIWEFIKKKARWSKAPISKRFKWIPEDFKGRANLAWHVFCNLTVVPNMLVASWSLVRDRETAWLLHPLLAFTTTITYGFNFIKGKVFKE